MPITEPVAARRSGGHRTRFPGWRIVAAFAVTQTVGYGALYYSFAVLLPPMTVDLHASEAAERMKQRVRDQNPDHVWELQLGGPDEVSNLKLMDADSNQDIGTRIRVQIMNLPDGTPIRTEVVD